LLEISRSLAQIRAQAIVHPADTITMRLRHRGQPPDRIQRATGTSALFLPLSFVFCVSECMTVRSDFCELRVDLALCAD